MKKGFGGVDMVEVRENMVWFLDGGYEIQSNFIVKIRAIRVSYLRVMLCSRGVILERLQPFYARSAVSSVVLFAII